MAKVSVGAIVATVVIVLVTFACWRVHAQAVLFVLAVLWAIGAPFWFFVEYFYIYRKAAAPNSWEQFKHGQQVAVAIWAGVTASLYGLGSSDLAKSAESRLKCTAHASTLAAVPPAASSPVTLELTCTPAK
jgi:hypothetical protein